MDARLKQMLTAILYLSSLVPMNGSSTVEGCTKHRWPRNDGIRHGHVIFGGIYSSTRQAIKGPAVVVGKKLYVYPEQYEGEECHPLLFCTGPVPRSRSNP